MIIVVVDYLNLIQWSNDEQVAWLVLPATWQLTPYPELISTVTREMLASPIILPRPGCPQNGVIDFIPQGTGFVPPATVYLVVGFVKHLLDI
jgi:hypothetical protein